MSLFSNNHSFYDGICVKCGDSALDGLSYDCGIRGEPSEYDDNDDYDEDYDEEDYDP